MHADDPTGRVQIVPVGPGQGRVLHWDGLQPRWAHWAPDGQRILLSVTESGQSRLYVTDVSGTAPKSITSDIFQPTGVAPDGHTIVTFQNRIWALRSLDGNSTRPIPGIRPLEAPIAWTSESNHIFTQQLSPTEIDIYKVDVNSGRHELWQAIKPKDQVGLKPTSSLSAITPDGRCIAFTYGTQLGQLFYRVTLK